MRRLTPVIQGVFLERRNKIFMYFREPGLAYHKINYVPQPAAQSFGHNLVGRVTEIGLGSLNCIEIFLLHYNYNFVSFVCLCFL